MKRLITLLLFVLLLTTTSANAQTIIEYKMTSGTIAWDASPKVATTDQANMYQVMWRTDLVSNGATVGSPILATQLPVTIPADVTSYYFGVKALRRQNNVTVAESAIAWSSDPAATNNAPWKFNTIVTPTWPGGIRVLP